jgi:hypothetical protein
MLSLRRMSPVLLPILFILVPASLSAYWPLEGTRLSTEPADQVYEVMVEDGSGGAIIIFIDDRYGNDDIFAQRVDANGNVMWDPDGVPVCTITGTQANVDAVSDGAGGAIITWDDARGGPRDIYVQRIGPDGVRLWNISGLSLCSAVNDQKYPRITTDGSGGGIVMWNDERDGRDDLYARRIDSSGSVHWTIWGIPVYTGGSRDNHHDHQIASDGLGGALVVWSDYREGAGNYNIYRNHIESDGTLSWGGGGLDVCDATGTQYYPVLHEITVDRVAAAWWDFRNPGNIELYAKVFGNSISYWGNGILISSNPDNQIDDYSVFGSLESGLIVCWRERRDFIYDVFAQRIDIDSDYGDICWASGGVRISVLDEAEDNPMMASDGQGGVIIVWTCTLMGGNVIKAQRVDRDGSLLWPAEGVTVSRRPCTHIVKGVISNGDGGVIAAYEDNSYDVVDPSDLSAQRIDRNGYIASPEPVIASASDVPLDQGGKVEITWDASYLDPWPYQEITEYSVWKSLSPASAMMLEERGIEYTSLQDLHADEKGEPGIPCGIIIRRETVGAAAYYWELIGTQAAQYYEGYSKVVDTDFTSQETSWTYSYYQVAAHAADPLIVWTSQPDSGYSLDNLAPAAPVGLAGEQEHSPEGMDLIWNSNSEEDLSHYVIYRGTDPSFIPTATNMVATVYDTMYFDGGWTWEPGWVYKVSAVDIHHNESGYALLLPDQVTGDDPPTPEYRDYLAQNFPNPFNPSTTIQFGLEKGGHVRLVIYDAAGRKVRELVNSTLPAGHYTEVWNGTNSAGQHISSGVYFYRLEAGDLSMRKKMILLR